VLDGFLQDIAKVIALGTIAVLVFAIVIQRLHGAGKQIARFFDLCSNLGQVSQLERSPVFFNQMHQWYPVENQVAIGIDVETFLWKIEGLVNQVKVSIGTVHLSQRFKWLANLQKESA
jgi:hypothetical protein